MLAVVGGPLAIFEPPLGVEHSFAGVDDDDRDAGTHFSQLLGDHRGRDAAPDDDDVGLVARHVSDPPGGPGHDLIRRGCGSYRD